MKTPYFIVYPAKIVENYRLMSSVLPVDRLYYATKPNGEAPTLSALIDEGANFELVCADEMEQLLSLGVKPEDMICSLPVKTAEEIRRMYALGCRYFVYDSERQYEMLCRLSPEAKKIVRINMRFTSPHDLVYGLYPEEIQEMAQRGMLPDGYTFHLAERDHWPEKLDAIFDELEKLISARGDTAPLILNLGGHYVLPQEDTQGALKKLRERVTRLKALRPDLTVIAEPGNCIVNSAYGMVTTVTETRRDDWVFTDATKNIIRNKFVDINNNLISDKEVHVEPLGEVRKCAPKRYYLLDSLCSGNIICAPVLDFEPQVGDRLIIREVGAYSICFANRFHWAGKPEITVASDAAGLDH